MLDIHADLLRPWEKNTCIFACVCESGVNGNGLIDFTN